MLQHVYPAWHRPAQKGFFVIAVGLCIALPVVYGSSRRLRKISARTMGIVLGIYFGLWALFSVVVRFLVPSPKVETTLPTYTPSPIPVPVVLHSPSRPNAVPTSPAIRLHPAGSAVGPATLPGPGAGPGQGPRVTITPASGTGAGERVRRSARFADFSNDDSMDTNFSYSLSTPGGRGNVTFQTRPRGYTTDSAHSAEFPTFAAYRQSQHRNFDALTQRFKRAFAISQQTTEQQQLAMMQNPVSANGLLDHPLASAATDPPSYSQTTPDLSGSSPTSFPLSTTTRSRSTSAASMFSDIAGRLRSGSFFSRSNATSNNNSNTLLLPPTRTSTDPLHYSHISNSSADSEIIRPSPLSSSPTASASYSSFPTSPTPLTTTTLTTDTSDSTATTIVSPETTMPSLQVLESHPPQLTGHDRILASSATALEPAASLSSRLQHDKGRDDDEEEGEDDPYAASSLPQSISHLVSTEKEKH